MQQRGAYVPIIIATESTFGTTPASGSEKLYYKSESLKFSRNLIPSETLRGTRQPVKPLRGNVDVAGDINVELGPEHGRLITHALGVLNTTGAGAPYTHEWTVGDLPAGMSIEKQFTDIAVAKYFLYKGCRVNSWKMSMKSEGVIDSTFSFMGRSETVNNATFDGSPTDLGLTPFDGFGGALYVDGAAIATVTSLDFSLENGLDGNSYVIGGAGARRWLPEGIAKVSGNITMLFEDIATYEDALNFVTKDIEVTLTNGTGTGASAGNEKMTIRFGEVILKPEAPAVSGPTGVTLTAPWEAFYASDSDASVMTVRLLSPIATF